jgi:translation initiation factor 3 subunit I
MRPILLKGHERSLTHCLFNADGDLLFTCSKDNRPTVWYAENGERVGTYEGHNGTVWGCDVTHDSTLLLTASADMTCKMWNVASGEEVWHLATPGPCRWVQWNEGCDKFVVVVDPFRGQPAKVMVFHLPEAGPGAIGAEPAVQFSLNVDAEGVAALKTGLRVPRVMWSALNATLVCGCEDGSLRIVDPATGVQQTCMQPHTAQIQDIQYNKEKTLFVTASKDHSSKAFDAQTYEVLTTFQTDRPVNSCIVHPDKLHVITGGGQDAMSVTTTAGQSGKFEARFFHLVFGDLFGLVKGHFGPINTLAIHPDGHSYVSGGEDGYVRLSTFDDSYMNMRDDVDDTELVALEKQVKDAGLLEEANKEETRNGGMSKVEA